MRLGLSEIISIFFIIFIVLAVAVMFRSFRNPANNEKATKSPLEIQERQVEPSKERGRQLKLAGVVFVVIAILLVLSGLSLLKWVVKAYLWSFVLLAIGMGLFFLSRKK